jgi:hypothetical protein
VVHDNEALLGGLVPTPPLAAEEDEEEVSKEVSVLGHWVLANVIASTGEYESGVKNESGRWL